MASVKVEREMQDRGCAGVRSQVGCLQKHAGKEQDPPGGLALGLLALWLVHSGPFLGRPSQSWQTMCVRTRSPQTRALLPPG